MEIFMKFKKIKTGSGCGPVVKALSFNTRDLRFESSHWQYFQLY